MTNADRTPETAPTIRATIRLDGFPIALTTDVRVLDDGPHEGEMDHRHLTELCAEIVTAAGSLDPYGSITVSDEDLGGPWVFRLVDAATWLEVGLIKVHAGAGA